jgi:hypothetical protein
MDRPIAVRFFQGIDEAHTLKHFLVTDADFEILSLLLTSWPREHSRAPIYRFSNNIANKPSKAISSVLTTMIDLIW